MPTSRTTAISTPPAFRRPTCRRATRSSCRSRSAGPRSLGARDLVIGVNALDYSGYPDCRPEFIARVRDARRARHPRRRRGQHASAIHTPLHRAHARPTSSAAGSRSAWTTGSRTAATTRCRDGRPCGRCDSCVLRAQRLLPKPASPTRCSCARIALICVEFLERQTDSPVSWRRRSACCSSRSIAAVLVVGQPDPARAAARGRAAWPHRWPRASAAHLDSYLDGLDAIAAAVAAPSRGDVARAAAAAERLFAQLLDASAAPHQHRPHAARRHARGVGGRRRAASGQIVARVDRQGDVDRRAGHQRFVPGPVSGKPVVTLGYPVRAADGERRRRARPERRSVAPGSGLRRACRCPTDRSSR